MKKKMLKEAYEWAVKKIDNGGGLPRFIVYIDPNLSENSYQYKEQIKKYGAKWNPNARFWYFEVSRDEQQRNQQIETMVKPCVEFLKSVEKKPNTMDSQGQVDKIIATIDELIRGMGTVGTQKVVDEVDTSLDPKDVQRRLQFFKIELINSFKDESWKEKMLPIIKFKQAQGPALSFSNSILIWVQDPQATMVKSRSNWEAANREIVPGAPALWVNCPNGKKVYTNKKDATIKWLKQNGKTDRDNLSDEEIEELKSQLTVGEKEFLKKYLNSVYASSFSYQKTYYDIRHTKQMEGKDDLVGSREAIDDIAWYDGVSNETEKSAQLYEAIIASIQKAGLRLTYTDENELGGARGVSMNGEIRVLTGIPKSPGADSTLVHEFAHELLHQTYLKRDDNYSKFFVGKQQGRDIVEQQAEITAWIVMRNFGYDMKTAVNYAGIWGADEKTCVKIFDTVATTANFIIKSIYESMESVNESRLNESEGLTGFDVARMLGKEALEKYKRGLKMTNENYKRITESFNKMLRKISRPLGENSDE